MTIREVAEDFVSKANPFSFGDISDPKTITYEIDGYPDMEYDLMLEYDSDDFCWYYGVAAYDKISGDRENGFWISILAGQTHTTELENMLTKYCEQFDW
jgi:hypothetical protein